MRNDNNHQNPTGLIAEIQRMSTEDGPGIRTTVFFKGCTLNCTWCHNPECISATPQIHWIESRCIGCKTCLEVCAQAALSFSPEGISIDRSRCDNCGSCAEECPSTAMELVGLTWNPDDLINELIKDKAYFETSQGGITLSGGDPTLQAPFVEILLKKLKQMGIQTAVDTCGACSNETLAKLLPQTDLVLFDIKEIDSQKHKIFTGQSNTRVFESLAFIRDAMAAHSCPGQLWIRTPIIPGATASEDNIQGIGEHIAEHVGPVVDRWELCAFNNLCQDKYQRLGLEWEFTGSELMRKSEMENLAAVAGNSGVNPDIVHWSGSTRIQNAKIRNPHSEIRNRQPSALGGSY